MNARNLVFPHFYDVDVPFTTVALLPRQTSIFLTIHAHKRT